MDDNRVNDNGLSLDKFDAVPNIAFPPILAYRRPCVDALPSRTLTPLSAGVRRLGVLSGLRYLDSIGGVTSGCFVDQRNSKLILSVSLLFYLTVVSFAAAFIWRGYAVAVERAEVQVATAAEAVASHAQWVVEAATQVILHLENLAAARDPGLGFQRVAGDLPRGFTFAVYDQAARQVFPDSPTSQLDEATVQELFGGLVDGSLVISHFLPEAAGGEGGFVIGRALQPGEAELALAVVHIPVALLTDFWHRLGLGPDSAISIVRRDGRLVARHPIPDSAVDLAGHRLFTELLTRAESGTYHSAVSPADGVARIVAYSAVHDMPLVTIAAVSRAHALGPYWQRVYTILLLGIPVLILLAALGGWQAYLLRRDDLRRSQLQETAEHNHLLLREVHHRVKNNLQIIASLIRMQNLPPESERDLRHRIMAMSALHEHLQGSGPAGRIALGSYLRRILEEVNHAYGDRLTLDLRLAEEVDVDADVATPLGLITNELVTNANKYAYPEGPPGTMTVTLAYYENRPAELAIFNDGVPFDAEPGSRGEGIRLIRSLANQVDPHFVFSGKQGLEFRISVPVLAPRNEKKP